VGGTKLMDRALKDLLDKQAIGEVIARYARTLDWLDDAGQASCYWPDAAIDYGFFKGSAADFVPVVMAIERRSQRRWHMLGGLIVRLTSPARAEAESYGIATGVREVDGAWTGTMYGGRYLDDFEKRGGEWRISSRRYILDWLLPLPDQPSCEPNPDFPLPILQIVQSQHCAYRPF
jgi:hypothetical protein